MDSAATSKISPLVLVVVIWVFTGIALLSACLRSAVVWRYRRGFSVDDALLIFACCGLLSGSILSQIGYPMLFLAQRISVDPIQALYDPNLLPDLVWFQTVDYTWEILGWTTIFVIKFAFLMFFKPLISGLPRLMTYWRIVFVFTFLAFIFCVSASFIACSKLGKAVVECSASQQWKVALAMGPVTITVDILADLAIVSMPCYLVWRIKVGPKKKLGAFIFLGLQILMIIVAVVRVAGCRMANTLDIPWIMLWQHVEASVSIATLSIAAFKSFYVSNQRQKGMSHRNTMEPRSRTPGTRTTLVIDEGEFEICNDESQVTDEKQWPLEPIKSMEKAYIPSESEWPLTCTSSIQTEEQRARSPSSC